MKRGDLIAIERKGGVTLYGRVIGSSGKLGQFEVYSPYTGNNGTVYTLYSQAKQRFNDIVAIWCK